jgi:predicted regulator of Ras-like GTPase activity (Roadblock/LC7/MglB family)
MTEEPIEDLRGSLAFTTLTDVLQFLQTTGRTGELWIEGGPEQRAAQVYFERGTVYHAQDGDVSGIEALVEVISWDEGTFIFSTNKMNPMVTIEVSLPNALVDAARRLDERRRAAEERASELAPQRLLDSFTESAGALAAILVARDGTLVASAKAEDGLDMDALGTGLADLVTTVMSVGTAQGCGDFSGICVEYDRFQLFCRPVAGTVLLVVAPERAQLGVIRHQTQHLADRLVEALPD